MSWNAWCNLCKWKPSVFIIACICMSFLAQSCCVSGFWALCKSQCWSGRITVSFPSCSHSRFSALPSPIVYREMFTVHTQRHHTNIQCIMLKPASGMLTNAQQRFSDSKVAHMSSPLMNGRPQCEEKVQLLDINDCYVFLSQRRSVKIDNTSSVTVKDRKRSDRMYVFPAVGQRAVSVCSNFLFFSCLDAEWHLTV